MKVIEWEDVKQNILDVAYTMELSNGETQDSIRLKDKLTMLENRVFEINEQ
jgi:hypothetical protein